MSSQLFQPLQHVHTDLAVQYYAQRAEVPGTLLITEATFIAAEAGGFRNVPGIWNDAQVAAWKKVVDAVHASGSYIFLQLWALGRAAQADVLKAEGNYPYVSSSATPMDEKHGVPQELSKEDIKRYVGHYVHAAKNAVFGAGFDGVEIHSANGYLLDQFLQDNCNQRTDEYGGSPENRSRLLLEVTEAVTAAVGQKKTGIRLSPWNTFQGMRMKNPIPTFSYALEQLVQKYPDLAYVHFVEPAGSLGPKDGAHDVGSAETPASNDFARAIWGPRTFLSAGGYDAKSALEAANKLENTGIVFGRYFISNPDLPKRLRTGAALTEFDANTFYTPGPKGYTDYPRAEEITAKM
ncbi:NADH:flavin oxidoreductase/NADH oxidase [Ceratobasidium sp. AG-Ba]|nr:NADH:flavin oxidoreductase/NADH oxidase [Ceratobasidium sp. AG-Ba]